MSAVHINSLLPQHANLTFAHRVSGSLREGELAKAKADAAAGEALIIGSVGIGFVGFFVATACAGLEGLPPLASRLLVGVPVAVTSAGVIDVLRSFGRRNFWDSRQG